MYILPSHSEVAVHPSSSNTHFTPAGLSRRGPARALPIDAAGLLIAVAGGRWPMNRWAGRLVGRWNLISTTIEYWGHAGPGWTVLAHAGTCWMQYWPKEARVFALVQEPGPCCENLSVTGPGRSRTMIPTQWRVFISLLLQVYPRV